jgi:hypothetical protein
MPDELQEGGGGLVVLTFYLLISNPFPSSFSAHHPSLYSHHHSLRAIDGPGKSPACSRLLVVNVERERGLYRVSELRKIYLRLLSSSP